LTNVGRRSPAELDELFEKKVKPWRFRGYITDVQKSRSGHLFATGQAQTTA
jgi:hypothetical protein